MNENICYRQLIETDDISDENICRIARLIYKTDKYIYPCLFENINNAERILCDLIASNTDEMFSLNNLYISESVDGAVIGIILWKQGNLNWNEKAIKNAMSNNHVNEPAFFQKVRNEYFQGYENVPEKEINILNVCVDEEYRSLGVATTMLKSFLAIHPATDMQLHVLAENKAAISVYKRAGFVQTDTINGFSQDDRNLPCYLMRLHTTDEKLALDCNRSSEYAEKHLKCLGSDCPNHCCKEYSGFSDRLQAIGGIGFSEILLLPRDVVNLQEAGMDSLIVKSLDGHRTIATSQEGVCGALKDGKCSIYPIRPAICRCYPLYLDLFVGMCELTECPGVEIGKPKHYDRTCIEELLSIYEYWIQYYRGKGKKEKGC